MNDFYEIWSDRSTDTPEMGKQLVAVVQRQDIAVAYPEMYGLIGAQVWHIEYTGGSRTATIIV